MVETKFINRKSFTATNTVRSAATITVLVLCLSAVQGENLTTLDGKTYKNITDISKYPKQIYFNCDSNRIGITITNLPEDFRMLHGIVLKTNTPIVAVLVPQQTPTNPTDLFLANNADSQLTAERMVEETIDQVVNNEGKIYFAKAGKWSIVLTPIKITLNAVNYTHTGSEKVYRDEAEMNLNMGQEVSMQSVFDKFSEWKSLAFTNKAESFNKEITNWVGGKSYNLDGLRHFTFVWDKENNQAGLQDSDTIAVSFSSTDVAQFTKLLKQVPDLKQELVQKIRSQKNQQGLFK
jgi:hypothetical protein